MNRMLVARGFRVKGRETFYVSIAEIYRDLDALHGPPTTSDADTKLSG